MIVCLYTRAGCHLCEDARQVLHEAQQRFHFQIQIVDVDSEPELVERYGLSVPVVTVNGKERFRGIINPALLQRLLRAEQQGRP